MVEPFTALLVGAFVTSIVSEVVKAAVDKFKKELKSPKAKSKTKLIQILTSAVKQLDDVRNDLVAASKKYGQLMETTNDFNSWETDASNSVKEGRDLIEEVSKYMKKKRAKLLPDRMSKLLGNRAIRQNQHKLGSYKTKLRKKCNLVVNLLDKSHKDFYGKPEKVIVFGSPPKRVLKQKAPEIKGFPSLQDPLDHTLEILEHDQDAKVIAICGTLGVGKTTVLRNLNNHEKAAKLFDRVIFLNVSAEGNDEKNLRQAIARRLKLDKLIKLGIITESDSKETISKILQNEKCLLLLDDVTKKLNLSELGVLDSNPGSKVVLTARRLPPTCKSMVDRKIEVDSNPGSKVVLSASKQVQVDHIAILQSNYMKDQIDGS